MLMFYFAKRRALNRIIILLFWRPNVCSVLASVKLGLCSSVLSKAITAAPRVGSTRPIFNTRLNKYPLYHTINRECTGG